MPESLTLLVNDLRAVADAINKRQSRPTPKQRRSWADKLWHTADAIDMLNAALPGTLMRHTRRCPAYGNYQPPYETCDCGFE